VRAAPEQYFWFHRRWKTKPPEPTPSAQGNPGAGDGPATTPD